jgi:SAM-dependent methyltransferase
MHLGRNYGDWQHRIVRFLIDRFGHSWFRNRRVLDLGCGNGDIAGALFRLGADVLAVDARQDHLNTISKRFPGLKTRCVDLDHEFPFREKFDLVLSLDLACHLKNTAQHIQQICAIGQQIVLETSTVNSNALDKELTFQENRLEPSFSFNGIGSMLTAAKIEDVLRAAKVSFRRIDDGNLNTNPFVYDWKMDGNQEALPRNRRLFVIANTDNPDTVAVPSFKPQIITPAPSLEAAQPKAATPAKFRPAQLTTARPAKRINTARQERRSQRISNTRPATDPLANTKVRVFYLYPNAPLLPQAAIDCCLQKNIENTAVSLVVVSSEANLTFDAILSKVNRLTENNDIAVICYADVFLDSSISLISKIGNKQVFALNSWDWALNQAPNLNPNAKDFDAFIFKGKIEGVSANIPFDKPNAGKRFAYELQQAGYQVSNPCRALKVYRYTAKNDRPTIDPIPEPYLDIEQTSL